MVAPCPFCWLWLGCVLGTESHAVAQAGFRFITILLPQSPRSWDYSLYTWVRVLFLIEKFLLRDVCDLSDNYYKKDKIHVFCKMHL